MLLSAALALLLAAPGPRCVQIAAMNDVHGRLERLPLLAGRLAQIRREGPTLLLDAGDGMQGTLEVALSRGESLVAAYRAMGLAAAALGNHDFDYGQEALRRRIAAAPYPFLSANLVERATGRLPGWPNLGGRRLFRFRGGPVVGVVGLAGEHTPYGTMPGNVRGLAFGRAARTLERQAKALRAEGAELVVAVAHLGGRCGPEREPADLSGCELDSDLFRLAQSLPPGLVDAVVGGHTHAYLRRLVNGVALLEAGAWGQALGWLTLCVGEAPRFRPFLRAAGARPDRRVAAAIAPYLAAARADRERPVGVTLASPLTRDSTALSPLGAASAGAIRAALGTDFGLMNAGGLRADLPAGELRYGQLFEAMPFEDGLAVLRVRLADLAQMSRALTRGGRGFPQWSGLRFQGGALTTCDGQPLDPDRVYTLGTNEFLAAGGDGLRRVVTRLGPENVAMRGDLLLRDAIAEWLRRAPADRLASPCP
jgi:5'-nucleotidase